MQEGMGDDFSIMAALPLLIVNINIFVFCLLKHSVCDSPPAHSFRGRITVDFSLIASGKEKKRARMHSRCKIQPLSVRNKNARNVI